MQKGNRMYEVTVFAFWKWKNTARQHIAELTSEGMKDFRYWFTLELVKWIEEEWKWEPSCVQLGTVGAGGMPVASSQEI